MLHRRGGGGRRRRREAPVPADTEFTPRRSGPHIPDGPYDADEEPDDGLTRLDFGALRIPVFDGVQVRFQVEEASGRPLAVAVTDGTSAMELSVCAAPRSSALWDEIRLEILDSLRAGGGFGEVGRGPFGTEILMRLPGGNPRAPIPGRMIGIDGPRWLLRAVVTGKAGTDPGAAPLLEKVLRSLVVVRGDEAMPVRDLLPLRLPREVTGQHDDEPGTPGAAAPGTSAPQSARVQMPVRGTRMRELG
jgi:hypothetical protein